MTSAPRQTAPPMRLDPIAIVGMACRFPKAESAEVYWSNIKAGRDAIVPVPSTHWTVDDYFDSDPQAPDRTIARRGGFLDACDVDPLMLGISPANFEATDTAQLFSMVVAAEAMKDAGYSVTPGGNSGGNSGGGGDSGGKAYDRARTSVILGVTGALELVIPLGARLGHPLWRKALDEAGVDKATADRVVERIAGGYVPWQENSFPGLLGNVAAGRIANRFDLGGTNCVVDAACASSLSAMHLACLELQAHQADMVLTGGVDTFNDIFMYMCFGKTQALSPSGHAKPFDVSADGTTLGEGVAILVIKRLADAERDGDRIHAVLRGIGTSSDGRGNAIYAPSAGGQARALRNTYEQAGVTPDTIELLEAHGTGTKVGDTIEVNALTTVYRDAKAEGTWCAVGSVKSQIGHTKAAAGIAGVVKAIWALKHKVLPPTIKVDRPNAAFTDDSPVYLNTELRPWLPRSDHPRRAAVSAFGFGGSNCHCVLEEYEAVKSVIDWDGDIQLFAWSADNAAAIATSLGKFDAEQDWPKLRAEAGQLRRAFDSTRHCRLLLVVEQGQNDVADLIAQALRMLKQQPDANAWQTPDGAYFGSGAKTGKLAAIFPGQGSQYVGMLRELVCTFPQALQTLADADISFDESGQSEHGRRLSDRIYPVPVFSAEARLDCEAKLRDTSVAQPALGAVSLGAWRVLEHFGVKADATAGHSYGELVALCVAGRIDAATLHRLSRVRGRLMAQGEGDRGGMLAVAAGATEVEKLIADAGLDLAIANYNAPHQVVLSGPTPMIERAAEAFKQQQVRCKVLPVAAAFHSRLVAAATAPFAAELAEVAIEPGRIPVYANASAEPYPDDPNDARQLLADQLARPVQFVQQIENLYAAGVDTFIEVGPGGTQSGLVRSILDQRPHQVLALDQAAGKKSNVAGLACMLASLAASGHDLALSRWDDLFEPCTAKKPALTVRITGANQTAPKLEAPPPPSLKQAKPAPASTPPPTSARMVQPSAPPSIEPSFAEPTMTTPHDSDAMRHALDATQQGLAALQKMHDQTASLHQQYLQGQQEAQRSIAGLFDQQQRLFQSTLGLAQTAPVAPVPAAPSLPVPPPPQVAPPVVDAAAAPVPSSTPPVSPAPPAPPVTPTPPPVATSEPSKPAVNDRFETVLLETVAEKTGYPVEMLDLDMELEADLGIDSIKRVEILSAMQEKLPEAPQVKPDDLGTMHSLRQIVEYLGAGAQVPASPTVAAASASASTEPAGADVSAIEQALLETVADKTGYPAEMLDLEMDLEADLGIDSIKRVEILSALQGKMPGLPEVSPEDLGALQTLRQVVDYLNGDYADTPVKAQSASAPADVATAKFDEPAIETSQPEELALQRSVLDVEPLDMQKRPAVRIADGATIWITDDGSPLAAAVVVQLAHRGYQPRVLPLDTVEAPAELAGLLILAPARGADDAFLLGAFKLLQRVAPALRAAGGNGGAVLATVSRLDGAFGLRGLGADAEPVSGGLAGLVKTALHEWPQVSCKALDLTDDFGTDAAMAKAVVDELLISGPVEVGLAAAGRCALVVKPVLIEDTPGDLPLGADDVVVITGGARGVTGEVAVALAQACQCKLLLLGRGSVPEPEPDWLAGLTAEDQIKAAILHRSEQRLNPRQLEERYGQLMTQRQMRQIFARIEEAGSELTYRSVDVRDAEAVGAAIAQVRRDAGPIRGLIHGAGVLADRLIEDKTVEQFESVYATKVAGLRSLLGALQGDDLKVLVLFSSSTARFGRKGQADYAAANEVLNKIARQQAQLRSGCRVLSINWGPWDGGMVTGSLRQVFADEGEGLIPLAGGAAELLSQMAAAPGADQLVETVVRVHPGNAPRNQPRHTSLAAVAASSKSGQMNTVLSFELDVLRFPFLRSHVLDGKAVVPMAVIVEWMAHGAIHENPGLTFHGVDELAVLKGLILTDDRPVSLAVTAGAMFAENGQQIVPVELQSDGERGRVLHARARIVLSEQLPTAQACLKLAATEPLAAVEPDEIYDGQNLFHGPDFHGIVGPIGYNFEGITAAYKSAAAPSAWFRQPLRSAWLADPLALDCSFQMVILWCLQSHEMHSLPTSLGRYRQYRRAFPKEGGYIVVQITHQSTHAVTADIEFLDGESQLVARLEGYQCVLDRSLAEAFKRNTLEEQVVS